MGVITVRKLIVLLVTVAVLAPMAASALGGPPPPTLAHIAVTHARPVAGHRFIGVTITKADAGIEQVFCAAKTGSTSLRAFKQRYYAGGLGRAAVTCRWSV